MKESKGPRFKCRECGKWDDPNRWIGGERLHERKLCLHCDAWTDRAEAFAAGAEDIAIVDGEFLTIGDEDSSNPFRGFGGRRFHFRFHDGREVVSTNVWTAGTNSVPPHFRERLPDNAEIIKEGAA